MEWSDELTANQRNPEYRRLSRNQGANHAVRRWGLEEVQAPWCPVEPEGQYSASYGQGQP
jgi:hypothetical protein